jgi:hypothetical protein
MAGGQVPSAAGASVASLEPGVHSVIVKAVDDSGPQGAEYAIGFFLVPETGPNDGGDGMALP